MISDLYTEHVQEQHSIPELENIIDCYAKKYNICYSDIEKSTQFLNSKQVQGQCEDFLLMNKQINSNLVVQLTVDQVNMDRKDMEISSHGTPILDSHLKLVDMITLNKERESESVRRKMKRKKISPVSQMLDFSEESDSDDSTQTESDHDSTITSQSESLDYKKSSQDSDISVIINNMETCFTKTLDKVIKSMNKSFEKQFKTFTKEVKSVLKETNKQFLNEVEDLKKSVGEKDSQIVALTAELNVLKSKSKLYDGRLSRLEKEVHDVKEDALQTEARMMRDRLLFYNIPEKQDGQDEDTKDTLLSFMKEHMKVSDNDLLMISVDNVFRIGQKMPDRNRVISAKMCTSISKQIVFSNVKNLDKSKKFGVSEQLPKELHSRKSRLMNKFFEAKQKKQNPKWSVDKLIVKNQIFKIEKDKVRDLNTTTEDVSLKMKPHHAPIKVYGGSTFQGHTVDVNNQDDIIPALHTIYMDSRVARATHNIYAYVLDDGYNVIEHYEDDNEWGGGKVILDQLKESGIVNCLVCVTRWFGGKNLGPPRFDYIKEAARMALRID